MNDWLQSLQVRERILVTLALVTAVIFIFYMAVWTPLQSSKQNLTDELNDKQDLLSWIQKSGVRLQALGPVSANRIAQADRSVLATVDSTAKQLGIRPSIKRIEPNGENQVTLWIEEMPFDSLMLFLGRLEKHAGISAENADIKRADNKSGKATARIVLKRGAADD